MAEETKNLETPATRGNRKERLGKVISNKMTKTIVVRVERRFPHPQFKKIVTSYKKFYAHDENSQAKVGDTVCIEESRPLSKLKHWRLVRVVTKAPGAVAEIVTEPVLTPPEPAKKTTESSPS